MLKDKTKSLKELGFKKLNPILPESPMVKKVFNLYEKPLSSFSVEDLRLMIGQEVALEFLMPIAIELLEENPFVSGDYFYGDLLQSVLSVKRSFWQNNIDLYWQVAEIVTALPQIIEDLLIEIKEFEKGESEILQNNLCGS